jgi:polysaccharide deacetylase 2 family uncharacterized protein YibQ
MAAGSISDADSPRRRGLNALALAWFSILALFVLTAVLTSIFGSARDGEPVVRMAIARLSGEAPPLRKAAEIAPQQPVLPTEQPVVPPALVPPTVTQPVYAGRALVADPALIETTPTGPLPRIADDGRTPMAAYASPVTVPPGHIKIAMIVSGLGISAKQTAAALAVLPRAVTLAFAPYESDAQRWVAEARKQGHEVLIEVPMEPYEFPDSDPGPHTLRSGQGEDQNTERLAWSLSRFTGYSGVTNMQGSRFLSDADSLAPVLTYLARRGLLFFDDGEATHSVAPDVASRAGIAFAQSTGKIDTIETAMEIDRKLSDLEAAARAHGSASGTGFIYPVTLERIASWAGGLNERGFVLVPASEIVSGASPQ